MKKALSILSVIAMMLTILTLSTFADNDCRTYPNITIDKNDFTIVKQDTNLTDALRVVGVDDSNVNHEFTDVEDDYITWTTSDSTVVKFVSGFSTISTKEGGAKAILKTMGTGTAKVTITYNPPDDDPVSVTSFVVVEEGSYTGDVTNVSIEVTAGDKTYCSQTDLTVKQFELKDIFGSSFDDSDVLKNSPSKIHGLLYALELENDDDGCTDIDDEDWDWDWVSSNVELDLQGGNIKKIGGYSHWQCKSNNEELENVSSATALEDDDEVDFEKSSW